MTSILLKQFIEGHRQTPLILYTKVIGHKAPKLLDKVIPDLTQNLLSASESFI